VLLALGFTITSIASEQPTVRARVSVDDGIYRLHSEVLIARTPAQVRRVLSDYARLPHINPGISTVKLLDTAANGEQRMAVEAAACVMMFCRQYRWVQRVQELADGSIQAVIEKSSTDSSPGDFRRGQTLYRFLPHEHCTRLVFEAELEPVFWIPAFVGPWLMERKLVTEALETARSVERFTAEETADSCPSLS